MTAMKRMFSQAPFKWLTNSPLFSCDGIKPISRNIFLNTFRNRAQSVVAPTSFSGHSFRRGGAQSLYDAGTPLDVIRDIGRWKSDIVMRRYYGYSVEQLSNLSLNVSRGRTRHLLDFHLLKAPTK
jgi:integrase